MKILVTGGLGFIGSCFIRYILSKYKNYQIINLDKISYCANLKNLVDVKNNPNYTFIKEDICSDNLDEILPDNIDIIVNFAAESHVDNSFSAQRVFAKTNILGTVNLLDFAIKNNIKKFVQISTDEVYGENLSGFSDENSQLNPTNPYSISKASADKFVLNYHKLYGLNINITRSCNNFGPYQYSEKLIPSFILKLLNNERIPLYKDGKQKRDWLYVYDNCEAIDLIMHKGKSGEIYNISAHNEKENIQIAEFLINYLNKDKNLISFVKDRLIHDFRYGITNDKILNLGWKLSSNFEENLANTIEWYIANSSNFS